VDKVLGRLRIRNFKAWRDTGQIELAPLTVLFGPNSSGKSSINHFLMMLKQTVRSPDRNSVFDFGDVNAAVRLGSFRDVIFGHDIDNALEFEQEWLLDSTINIRDPRSGRRYAGNRLFFKGAARQLPGKGRVVQSEGFAYRVDSGHGTELAVALSRDQRRPNRWRLDAENYELVRNPGRAWELPKPVQFHGFPSEAAVYYQNTAFLAELELALEGQLDRISYLGPLRSPPERLYTWSGAVPEDVGWRGQNAVQSILAARERKMNWRPRSPRVPFVQVVAEWLETMGLIHSFTVSEIAPEREEFEVRVRVAPGANEVKLSDVGFGVSQVLPVIVQAFYAPPNSTVLMEQPEIHLHPSVQSSLADLLIAAIGAREEGEPRGVQLVIESHSEHLLRRLQRRIAEGQIEEQDVALYFCYPGAKGAAIDRLQVDTYGDILNWPPNFFGDELEDVTVQAEVGMQRKLDLSG
jgi:predicted ATPase